MKMNTDIIIYCNQRLAKLRGAQKKIPTSTEPKKRHLAYKQVHGRILEMEMLLREMKRGRV